MCAPLSGLQLQHSLADVPVWTGQPLWRKQLLPINSSCFFPKELFNYLKSFSWVDNLLPFKEKKKSPKQHQAVVELGSQDSKHRGQCGLSSFSQQRSSCSSLVWRKMSANIKNHGLPRPNLWWKRSDGGKWTWWLGLLSSIFSESSQSS